MDSIQEKTKALVRSLALSEISDLEFLERFPDRSIEKESFVRTMIHSAREEKNDWMVSIAVIAYCIQRGKYTYSVDSSELCSLLFEGWHTAQEDIAFTLQRIAGPEDVDCLYRAAGLSYPHLEYDETFQFARKCIKALYAIGTKEAMEELRQLSNSANEVIAGYALKELNRGPKNA